MKNSHRPKILNSRKGFLAGVVVDFWSYIVFVFVLVVFALIFKFGAEAKLQSITDQQDIVYGNYLAQVYLRQPILVAGKEFTMAELIALYDYNQTLEYELHPDAFIFNPNSPVFLIGSNSPMRDAIVKVTDDFVDSYYDKFCHSFAIKGKVFEYSVMSAGCGVTFGFSPVYVINSIDNIPKNLYYTYVAPVDPRSDPIVISSIYDFQRMIDLYGGDDIIDMVGARNIARVAFCSAGFVGCAASEAANWMSDTA